MSRILVCYYSRTGYTEQVAGKLARLLGADLMCIRERRPRTGIGGYLRSAWEALRGRDADILPPDTRLRDYELVVLGTPVWAGHAASPVRTLARQQRDQIRRAGVFCTLGGSRQVAALADLAQDLHQTPWPTLALSDGEIEVEGYEEKLTSFAAALRSRLNAEPAGRAGILGVDHGSTQFDPACLAPQAQPSAAERCRR